jgi:hypothetical protein
MASYAQDACRNMHKSSLKLSTTVNRIKKKTGMCSHILTEVSSIKFHVNPFSGSKVITCGQGDRQA